MVRRYDGELARNFRPSNPRSKCVAKSMVVVCLVISLLNRYVFTTLLALKAFINSLSVNPSPASAKTSFFPNNHPRKTSWVWESRPSYSAPALSRSLMCFVTSAKIPPLIAHNATLMVQTTTFYQSLRKLHYSSDFNNFLSFDYLVFSLLNHLLLDPWFLLTFQHTSQFISNFA